MYTQKDDEEEEHSLEMHLPYIQKMLSGQPFKLVPIMVGNTDYKTEEKFAKVLAKYFDQDNTLFVISSDFCHWGKRFQYTYYKQEDGKIWQSIENLDTRGMNAIAAQDAKEFDNYLQETHNTICGRHPIGILLKIIQQSKYAQKLKTKFVKYAQSSHCESAKDSSVSYAAAVTYLPQE